MDLLRHGGVGKLFTGIRAPSMLGTFLQTFTFGQVRVRREAPTTRVEVRDLRRRPVAAGR